MVGGLCRLLIGALAIGSAAAGQTVQQGYWHAAQLYNNAAAQCTNPAGATCLRQNAAYYQCLGDAMQSNGPSLSSCGSQPTCNTSCVGSGTGGAPAGASPGQSNSSNGTSSSNLIGPLLQGMGSFASSPSQPSIRAGSGQSNPFCNDPANKTVGLMLQNAGACGGGGLSPAAAKFNAIQNNLQKNQQMVNNAGNAILGFISLFGHDDDADNATPDTESDPEPDPAAEAAAREAQINAEAAGLLASANALLLSLPGAAPATPTQPDSNAALSALLDDGPPSNSSTAAINSLLGDSQGAGAGPATNAVNNLLAENDTPAPATNTPQPGDPFYQPPPATSVPYNGPFPDSDITIDWGETADAPDPTMFDTLKQNLQSMAQGVEQKVSDALAPVIDETKQAISYTQQQIAPFVNDPGIQGISQVVSGGGTTMPLTRPGDTPDTMGNNVYGTATAGGINLVKGPTGLGTYMNGNVNQINAGLGWANSQIIGTHGGAEQ